jgi:hypothetical protein
VHWSAALDLILGVSNVVVPAALLAGALAVALRRGDLRRGILYLVFLPARRRMVLRLLALTAGLFFIGGVAIGVSTLANLPDTLSDLLVSVPDIAGCVAMFALVTRALAPRQLSIAERVQLDAQPAARAALRVRGVHDWD